MYKLSVTKLILFAMQLVLIVLFVDAIGGLNETAGILGLFIMLISSAIFIGWWLSD
jgi:hypothetical protein